VHTPDGGVNGEGAHGGADGGGTGGSDGGGEGEGVVLLTKYWIPPTVPTPINPKAATKMQTGNSIRL